MDWRCALRCVHTGRTPLEDTPMIPKTSKRLRTDADFVEAIAKAVMRGGSSGALQLARARGNCSNGTAMTIEQRFLHEYRHGMLDTFEEPSDVWLALDVSRVSKPAKDTL